MSNTFFTTRYNESSFLSFIRRFLGEEFEDGAKKSLILSEKFKFLTKYRHLGSISLDNDGLREDVLVLEVTQRSLRDARVGITKETVKLIKSNANFSGYFTALVVFKSPEQSDNRRFSLIKSDDGQTRNNARRFSYYLGQDEGYKTPQQYLVDQGPIKDLPDLISRFDVEVVRKEFFDLYLELFVRLYSTIVDDKEFAALLQSQEVDLVSFTKNLLGKIIFLYFIQQKGWLGLGRERKEYGEGDKNFMRTLWKNFEEHGEFLATEKTGNFYNDYLEHLFYNGLNKDRRDDDDRFQDLNMKVPFLNGGLFREEYRGRKDNKAKLSNDIFSNFSTKGEDADGILDIFDRYNFTVDEDNLYDTNIAVDPEMLGRIFEKMISISSDNIDEVLDLYKKSKGRRVDFGNKLNKKLGAFYTPREIVHYMTKESLIAYLVNALDGDDDHNESLLRDLFTLKEQFLIHDDDLHDTAVDTTIFDTLTPLVSTIDDALQTVKILDPAVGSGAFPMGLLHEISTLRYYIYGRFPNEFDDLDTYKDSRGKLSMYEFKRQIILRNIYGVDIDPGAIDIAKLRFWLSLVVDEEAPHPLPNFEFKFVVANTLIPLAEEEDNDQLFAQDIPKLETLKRYMREYYNADSKQIKKSLRDRIRSYTKEEQQNLFTEIPLRAQQIAEFGDNFDNPKHAHSFFDPSLMMSEWRGFDIVIGNPPYIKEYENRLAFEGLKDREYYMGKMDIWYYFACYGLDLLKNGGIQSFIAQNNRITSAGAKIMRNKILEDAKIKEFIDFGNYKVFEGVGIQTMLYVLKKTTDNLSYEVKYARMNNEKFDRNRIAIFLEDRGSTEDYDKHSSTIQREEYFDKTLNFVNERVDAALGKLFDKNTFFLKEKEVAQGIVYPQDSLNGKNNIKLGGVFEVGDGIFVLNNSELSRMNLLDNEMDLIKPEFSTRELGRYYANPHNTSRVIYTDSTFKDLSKIEKYPHIKTHLDKFKEVITSDNKPYGLHRARDEKFFKGEKIIATRKCAKPTFSYVDFDSYVSATFYIIKTDRIDQKYLTGLLNSILIEFRLRFKGKMQGDNYQLDKGPLLEIPIFDASKEQQEEIIALVDQIIEAKQSDPDTDTSDLEAQIDQLVYKLYDLTDEEIAIVEESVK